MTRTRRLPALAGFLGGSLAALLLAVPLGAQAAPEVGDKAPAFSLAGSDGRTHALSDHLGKRGVVLAWFPKAFTPG